MTKTGGEHFVEYTPQNRVKHAILKKYYAAYLGALSRPADGFHYIDGFAGQGTYEDGKPGSPVLALELLTSQRKPASASFIESDSKLEANLAATVAKFPNLSKLFDPPLIRNAEFSDCIDDVLTRPIYRKYPKTATFAFVDPCGVKGLQIAGLARILAKPFGECLVFWNYDGLNRWLGAINKGSHSREKLDTFYGSLDEASNALEIARRPPSKQKERALRDGYMNALRKSADAKFLLPFRFEASDSQRTSHYLIHLSRHELAFKIMKEVMAKVATDSGDVGSFEFVPAADLGAQTEMFRPNQDLARAEVLQKIHEGVTPVAMFTEEWPLRPQDYLVAEHYRDILRSLEREGRIEVFITATGKLKPPVKRMRDGKATFGATCSVRLRSF